MALDGDKMGDEIAQAIMDSGASDEAKAAIIAVWKKISGVICKHIDTNLEVTIPTSQVVIAVTGQATGTKNPAPITLDVDK